MNSSTTQHDTTRDETPRGGLASAVSRSQQSSVCSRGLPAASALITVWICTGRFMSMCAFACVSDPVIDWKEEQWHSCARTSRWLWKPNPKPSFVLATECRECRMLLPPSGDTGQNRTIVPKPAEGNKCCRATIADKTHELTNIDMEDIMDHNQSVLHHQGELFIFKGQSVGNSWECFWK